MGSGSLTPSGLFEKAHSICMGEMSLPKPAASGLTATQINNTLRGYVSKLKSSSCQASEDSLKNYYVKGEVNECESGYNYDSDKGTCVDSSGNEIEVSESKESSFMSAKKSCEAFENALISSRDNMYAKFQDNMTNYLDEHLAKLMKKQAKSNTTIAQAFQTLKKTDAENQKADIENETEMLELRAEQAKTTAKSATTLKSAYSQLVKAYETTLTKKCNALVSDLQLTSDIVTKVDNLSVCLSAMGETTLPDEQGRCLSATKLKCISDVGLNSSKVYEAVAATAPGKSSISVGESGTLQKGVYEITVAGGKGDDGSSRRCGWRVDRHSGGDGGKGEIITKIFSLETGAKYTSSMQKPSSKFDISGVVSISARFGGKGSNAHCGGSGGDGTSYGTNTGGAYIRLYKFQTVD